METIEIWADIPDYEELYAVSTQGRIKSFHLWRASSERILKPSPGPKGYLHIRLVKDGKQRMYLVHRLVAATFIGPCPSIKQVNHRNGKKADNVLENLEYVTQSENIRHAYDELGRKIVRGEANGRAKLTKIEVRKIRRRYKEGGITLKKLAAEFGAHHSLIGRIIRRELWRHI